MVKFQNCLQDLLCVTKSNIHSLSNSEIPIQTCVYIKTCKPCPGQLYSCHLKPGNLFLLSRMNNQMAIYLENRLRLSEIKKATQWHGQSSNMMALWLRALAALTKDPGSISRSHTRWLRTTCYSNSRATNTLLGQLISIIIIFSQKFFRDIPLGLSLRNHPLMLVSLPPEQHPGWVGQAVLPLCHK